ncbi:MAG: iron ABC transporter permease [Gammaproteobacteria bacterium]|nr:MAG: iron ABC transporter permease [Gammaproteobacteria bacterium]
MVPARIFGFTLLAWLAAILLFAPIAALIVEAISQPSPSFRHLWDTVLWDYIENSLILVVGVCLMAVIWGLPSAWLTTRYEFPGRRFFRWALLLPMAMPAYVVAYIYTDLFDYSGIVQNTIRDLFGFQSAQDYWFFDIRTMGGAIFVLSLVFSPYVYWITSLNFNAQCQSLVHASRLLGANEYKTFFRVVLPLSRPALAVACSLVAMETLADFGTVSYFSVWNVTTAIYDTWLSLSDLSAAAKLACLLLLFVVILIALEKTSRRRSRYHNQHTMPLIRQQLQGKSRYLATAWCSLVVFWGFLLPMIMVINYAVMYLFDTKWAEFYKMLYYSLLLATTVAVSAVLIALIVLTAQRFGQRKLTAIPRQISSLGYAVPGTVLAIGVLIVTSGADHRINEFFNAIGISSRGLIFSGTLIAMGYAFLSRFAAIGIGSVDSGLVKIPYSLDQTAQLCGHRPLSTVKKVLLPLLRNSLLTAFLLVFLESLKELSAAILLRPFNVETLATYVYQYMSAEEFEVAALPALVIVLAGLPPVIILTASMNRK